MFKPQHASACFRVVVSVPPGFHGAIHDTEEDYQMPSVTECKASRNGTYYINDVRKTANEGVIPSRAPLLGALTAEAVQA
jgi:hypothetical protein